MSGWVSFIETTTANSRSNTTRNLVLLSLKMNEAINPTQCPVVYILIKTFPYFDENNECFWVLEKLVHQE